MWISTGLISPRSLLLAAGVRFPPDIAETRARGLDLGSNDAVAAIYGPGQILQEAFHIERAHGW